MVETNMPYITENSEANRLIVSMKTAIDKAQTIIFQQWLTIAKQERVIEALKQERRDGR